MLKQRKEKKEGNKEIWKRQDSVAWKMMNLGPISVGGSKRRNQLFFFLLLHWEAFVGAKS